MKSEMHMYNLQSGPMVKVLCTRGSQFCFGFVFLVFLVFFIHVTHLLLHSSESFSYRSDYIFASPFLSSENRVSADVLMFAAN